MYSSTWPVHFPFRRQFSPLHGRRRHRVRCRYRRCVSFRNSVLHRDRSSSALDPDPFSRARLDSRFDSRFFVSRAGVPRRVAITSAAAVGALGSLATLIFAYREPLNRCRCSRIEVASTSSRGRKSFRAHCARCRKRTRLGVAVSFVFSPCYVAVASGATALCAHVVGRKCVGAMRKLVRGASERARRRRR